MKKAVFNNLFLAGLTAIVLSACGSSGSRDLGLDLTQGQQGNGTGGGLTPPPPGTNPADSLNRTMLGSNDVYSFGYATDHMFKIRIRPLPVTAQSTYANNYSFDYSCISLKITVNGNQVSTGPIRVAGVPISVRPICDSSVPTERTFDLSQYISGSYVNFTISEASYDYARIFSGSVYINGVSYFQNGHLYGAFGMQNLITAYNHPSNPASSHKVNFNGTYQIDGTYMPQ